MDFTNSPAYYQALATFKPIMQELIVSRFKQRVFDQLKNASFQTDRVTPVNQFIDQLIREFGNPEFTPENQRAYMYMLYGNVKSEYDALVNGELFRTYQYDRAGLVFEANWRKQQANNATYGVNSTTTANTDVPVDQNNVNQSNSLHNQQASPQDISTGTDLDQLPDGGKNVERDQ